MKLIDSRICGVICTEIKGGNMVESALNRMRLRCFKLGKEMPDEVEHEILMKILAKVIVQEKVQDDDAFDYASSAYAEGFSGANMGDMTND
jgi:hypothetical protein